MKCSPKINERKFIYILIQLKIRKINFFYEYIIVQYTCVSIKYVCRYKYIFAYFSCYAMHKGVLVYAYMYSIMYIDLKRHLLKIKMKKYAEKFHFYLCSFIVFFCYITTYYINIFLLWSKNKINVCVCVLREYVLFVCYLCFLENVIKGNLNKSFLRNMYFDTIFIKRFLADFLANENILNFSYLAHHIHRKLYNT